MTQETKTAKYYSSVQASKLLGIAQFTIARWCRQGVIGTLGDNGEVVKLQKLGEAPSAPWLIPLDVIEAVKEALENEGRPQRVVRGQGVFQPSGSARGRPLGRRSE